MVVKEKDKEEERFLNWILERIPGCEEIGFLPIIHDLNCYFLNYRDAKLPEEEPKQETRSFGKMKVNRSGPTLRLSRSHFHHIVI